MITLITGVPGAGKTLYCVSQILLPESKTDRPIYVDGIPDLLPRHEVAPDVLDWPTWAPQGAHIFIDEVQRVWRPESAGKLPHPSIAELETHRHRGLDFTIMTQHPSLVHANVRRLVGKHIHVRRTALGVKVYEYSECQAQPDTAWRNAMTKFSWKHPKDAFGLYKSASLHVKVKYRLPPAVKVLAVCVLGIGFLGYKMFDKFYTTLNPEQAAVAMEELTPGGQSSSAAAHVVSGVAGVLPVTAGKPQPVEEVDPREAFVPRVYGEPWTAPAYDGMRVVRNMPRVVACVASETKCACYTEQMTVIQMTDSQCRERLDGGGVYDPYNEKPAISGSGGGERSTPLEQATQES